MAHKLSIEVGVKELELRPSCIYQPQEGCCAQIKISFTLQGDFVGAGINDDIHQSVDYASICTDLEKLVGQVDCSQGDELISQIAHTITTNSSLITGGYLKVALRCHQSFIKEKCLL